MDPRLGDDGSQADANGSNLLTTGLERATMSGKSSVNRSQVGRIRLYSHALRLHPEYIRAGRLV